VQKVRPPAAETLAEIIRRSGGASTLSALAANVGAAPGTAPFADGLGGVMLAALLGPAAPTAGPVREQAFAFAPREATRIAIVGDSLAIQLWQGLRDAFADRQTIVLDQQARTETGLVNPGQPSWNETLRAIVGAAELPSVVVVMIGANDNQRIRAAEGETFEPLGEGWREAYAQRIDAILDPAREAGVKLIWVGMPIMRSTRHAAAMLAINEIYRARVERAGFVYLDVWSIFANAEGGFSATGPDVTGEIVRLRAADGVHLTRAGSVKLAFFVEKALGELLAPEAPSSGPASLPAEIDAQIEGQPAAPRPTTLEEMLGDVAGDLPPPFPVKPAYGPIQRLTIEPAGAALASGAAAPSAAIDPVFVEGRAPYARPGRGDDFSWPRR
jgi:hypothetical protein